MCEAEAADGCLRGNSGSTVRSFITEIHDMIVREWRTDEVSLRILYVDSEKKVSLTDMLDIYDVVSGPL